MSRTINIPLVTVNPGTRTFGPTSLADTDVMIDFTIDRTVTNGAVQGFNGQPATTTATISFEQSNDGGTTWTELCSATIVGGVYTMHGGLPVNSDDVGTFLFPGTSRQGRAIVVVTGAAVAVQGTLVIS